MIDQGTHAQDVCERVVEAPEGHSEESGRLDDSTTCDLKKLAYLLDLSPRRVNQLAADETLPRVGRGVYPVLACVRRYVAYLTEAVEGSSTDLGALHLARIKSLKLRNDNLAFDLAEKESTVVAVDELEPALQAAFSHIKPALQAMCDKIKAQIDAQYATDLDVTLLLTETDHALSELAKHCPDVLEGGNCK